MENGQIRIHILFREFNKGINMTNEMIDFLKEIKAERKKEETATRTPVYIVYDLVERFIAGHNDDYELTPNLRRKQKEFGYLVGEDSEDFEFAYERDTEEDEEFTRYWTDRFVAMFFTRKAAKEYMQYQKHNLSDPYIYEEYPGYHNRQMDKFFELLEKLE